MQSIGLLILGSVLGAFICAKARVASGAVVFSLLALVLFIGTPAGGALPGAIASVMSSVDRATTPVLTDEAVPASGRAGR